mgnify:FL=1
MRYALRFRPLAGGEYLLPLPQTLPGQEVGEVFLSHKPLEVYEAQGNLLARFALEEGEALEARFRLRTTPLQAKPSWREAPLREPPEAWPGILAHRGHRVERALGIVRKGDAQGRSLADRVDLGGRRIQDHRENPALLLPLGVAPDPRSYLGGHEGKRLLLLKTPWPGEEDPLWGELRSLGLDPLPPARALAFLSLGASALGLSTGPWPYLPYLALLALRQGPALKDLLRQSPRHALESLLFHAFALSVTTEVRPELGLAYLGLLFWNRTRPPWREGPHLG